MKYIFKNSEYNFVKRNNYKSDWNFYDSTNLFKERITIASKDEIRIIEDIIIIGNEKQNHDRKIIFVDTQEINENSLEYQILILSDVKGISSSKASSIMSDNGFSTVKELLEALKNGKKINGIGNKRKQLIERQLEEEINKRDFYNIILLLDSRNMAQKLIKEFGECAMEKIKLFPYETLKPLIGFKKTDEICINKFNIDLNDETRIKYLIEYKFNEFNSKQSNYIELNDFTKYLLENKINCSVESILKNDLLYVENENVYLKEVYNAEIKSAKILSKSFYRELNNNIQDIIEEYEDRNYQLHETQKEAVKVLFKEPLSILTGGAGTGKTTVTKCAIECLESHGYECILLAPTGKAALRMREVTNRQARTIHSLTYILESDEDLDGDYFFDKFKCSINSKKILIVDEFSMVDQILFYRLLRLIIEKELNIIKVIMIGDPYQLQSVGSGKVLSDLLESNKIKHVKLTKTFRQQEGNVIIQESTNVRNALPVNVELKTNEFFVKEFSEQLLDTLIAKIRPKFLSDVDFYRNVQITTSLNKTCDVINEKFRRDNKNRFAVNDKVINLKNDSDRGIVNGDFGIVQSIREEQITDKKKTEITTVYFYDSERIVEFTKGEYSQIKLAYATTVHKLQGSEYEYIIIIIDKDNPILNHKLLYTAITRGKKHVIILGEKEIINKAATRKQDWLRKTTFKEKLIQEFN
jgi:exodeoxyribonuclease V alpha subunit